ncbi:MAG: hypothetical protein ACXWXV_07275 [Aeromicrobium sp.]
MTISPKESLVALVVAALGTAAIVGVVLNSWKGAILCVVALQMVHIAVVLLLARRRTPSGRDAKTLARIERAINEGEDLARMERAIENVSLRVVTESDATRRELVGLIDELGRSAKKPD